MEIPQASLSSPHLNVGRKRKGLRNPSTFLGTNASHGSEKCHSLLNFPLTFVNCVNAGDIASLGKLIQMRISHDCEFYVVNIRLNLTGFMAVLQLLNDLYPDSIISVPKTHVTGNEIHSVSNYQSTDNRIITNSMVPQLPDPRLYAMGSGPRSDPTQLQSFLKSHPEEERDRLEALLNEAESVVVHGRCWLKFLFHPFSKKITSIHVDYQYNSFAAVI